MAHAAVGDCERPRSGLVGQPVNTVTSAAYLVAAGWVWHRAARRRGLWTVVLTWTAFGSIAYHGPGTRAGKLVHDSALAALVVAMGTGARTNRRLGGAAALASTAAVIHATTRSGCRACRPDSVLQGHGLWHILSAAAIALWADGE